MGSVWVAGKWLCAIMPGLLFQNKKFKPMWEEGGYIKRYNDMGEEVICIRKPNVPTIIRSGRGWGRRGRDVYYLYEPPDNVTKLVKRPMKKLYEKKWITCVEERRTGKKWCFEWINGELVAVREPLSR